MQCSTASDNNFKRPSRSRALDGLFLIMNEIWKEIEGYEGLYEVSNLGRVRSLGNDKNRKTKILKPGTNGRYLFVYISKSGKSKPFYIHRLVASAFIENPNNFSDVNHKNEIKTDNRLENLKWMSRKDNLNYGTHNQRMAETKRGKPTWNKGKHHSEETRRKMSESRKRYLQSKSAIRTY